MMKQFKNIFIVIFLAGIFSCRKDTLSIPGTNAITSDQVFSSVATVNAYLATLYANMPLEDFAFCNGQFGQFPGDGNSYTANWTDEAFDNRNSEGQLKDLFAQLYRGIRTTNNFIAEVPKAAGFSDAQKNYWLGEAKFVRAYQYFGLVKYYGGVPIITTIQEKPVPTPRNKEEEVWDLIKADLESAISLMDETMPNANYGHATKWAALALEARAMLHAGSIGRFDNTNNYSTTGGINGVSAAKATAYLTAAYNAAKTIINSNKFSLFNKYPTDPVQNFQYLFYDASVGTSNTEGLFYKGYDWPTATFTHSQDLLVLAHAIQSATGYGNRLMPSMDMVEKFQMKDGSSGAIGADKGYTLANNMNVQLHYPAMSSPFANKDPRFAATIIAPGTAFRNSGDPAKGLQGGWVTSQRGVIQGGTIYNASNYSQFFNTSTKTFSGSSSAIPVAPNVWGSGNSGGSPTDLGTDNAFWLKKWTDPVIDIGLLKDWTSRTAWVDLRLGEILMIYAEASFELGNPASEALDAVNKIRARAGMPPYLTITRDLIRAERFVEFAFENKSYWDYVRWRTLTTDFVNRQLYGLRIYWDVDTNDYVFIKVPANTKTYQNRNYYFDIPINNISTNPAIGAQVNGGHNPGY